MYVNLSETNLYYTVQGAGSPILLLHGWGVDSNSLASISQFLETRGMSVYAIDFPGFGKTAKPPGAWSVDDYVSIVVEFLKYRKLASVDVLAHSFGGRVAIKLAANYGNLVKRLILTGCAGLRPMSSNGSRLFAAWVKLAKLSQLEKTFPELREAYIRRFAGLDYKTAGELRDTLKIVINEDLRQYLPKISQETLLVWGENDSATPLKDGRLMHHLIKQSSLEIIPGAGHYCFYDDFDVFMKYVALFLWKELR